MIIIFAAFGLDAGTSVTEDVDTVQHSANGFLDSIVEYVNGIDTSINVTTESAVVAVDAAIGAIQTPMARVRANKDSLVAGTRSVADKFMAFPNGLSASCPKCVAYNLAIGQASDNMKNFKIPNVNFTFSGDKLRSEMSSGVGSITDIMHDTKSNMQKSKSDVSTSREDARQYEDAIKQASITIFACVIGIVVLSAVGIAVSMKPIVYLAFALMTSAMFWSWVLFLILFLTTYVVDDTCDIIPYTGSTNGHILPKYLEGSGDVKAQAQRFIDDCIVGTGGNLFTVLNVSTGSFNKTLDKFDLSSQFNTTDVTDWDQSALDEVSSSTDGVAALTPTELFGAAYTAQPAAQKAQTEAHLATIQSETATVRTTQSATKSDVLLLQGRMSTVGQTLRSTLDDLIVAFQAKMAAVTCTGLDSPGCAVRYATSAPVTLTSCGSRIGVGFQWFPIPLFKLLKRREAKPESAFTPAFAQQAPAQPGVIRATTSSELSAISPKGTAPSMSPPPPPPGQPPPQPLYPAMEMQQMQQPAAQPEQQQYAQGLYPPIDDVPQDNYQPPFPAAAYPNPPNYQAQQIPQQVSQEAALQAQGWNWHRGNNND
eukprot:CAMPEP_0114568998 /NCGR_PEP_ID=MMETSP0114-20121206/16364_1 /TAXON_ID=31324 /ORGANISM="Goniomonas sp, Strain m" /LENGTH=595 /DNA_ID=CAMNT_0001755793 /DNA_START=463 /DNA_END=2248 /DNA_ORIENTATION=-